MKPVIFDFETKGIQARPQYPPEPVGVAIKYPGKKSRYYAFGHPTKNNCTRQDAVAALTEAWKHTTVAHNSKFDNDVANVHFGLAWPAADRFHDTLILAYLDDPHSKQIDLKNLSIKHLNRDPAERDELKEWILSNIKCKPSEWGAHIADAPGDLVGRYACADTDMTAGLFDVLHPRIVAAEMEVAYHREKELLHILVGMEERGIPVDADKLEKDLTEYSKLLDKINKWVQGYLGTEFNVDSAEALANALDASGKAGDWLLTPTGKRSTSKDSIKAAITDETLTLMLDYRSTLANYVQNFMSPWNRMAEQHGVIFTQWSSTKQEAKGGSRTGRLTSSPNFQNVPNDERWKEANERFAKLYKKYKWLKVLPQIRNYIVAPKGYVILDRDYSQQEPRTLAHFEDGLLCAAYKADPRMDIYVYGVKVVEEMTGILLHKDPKFARKIMKTIILAIMYGLGLGRLAERLEITVDEAKKFQNAILVSLPGVKVLTTDLKSRGRRGEPMRTWGGRVYYVEPSMVIKGRLREFGYKLVNYLIQGSSADMTKEAMIRYEKIKQHGFLLLTVHDELMLLVEERYAASEMKLLKQAMDSVELDAPLVSDGEMGYRWGELESCE